MDPGVVNGLLGSIERTPGNAELQSSMAEPISPREIKVRMAVQKGSVESNVVSQGESHNRERKASAANPLSCPYLCGSPSSSVARQRVAHVSRW